jgi:two-component system cell cycle sensor histidine kinase/response regulator CckA
VDPAVAVEDAHAAAAGEEALTASRPVVDDRAAAFARLFEAVHEGVYIGLVDGATTTTLAANPHLKLLLGYLPDTFERDVRPFDAARFVDPQARTAFLERLANAGSVSDYLVRLKKADGTQAWIEVTATADPTGANGALRVEALVRDVSERKQLEVQSRDLYYQLLQTEKMAALGQTISGVAHELNNPLATILSWAERLSQHVEAGDPVKRGLDVILSESERAARIVRNLLTFARKRQSTRALVDLNEIVRETLNLRAYEQRITNISVIPALAAGLPSVFADGHQVKQVLLNLLMNAEQAMLGANGRGTIVIRTWHDSARQMVVLEVNDDGPGVAEDVQGKIFDPFFTTKEVGKGTGLGLTVAYAIVQEHGGRIRLESKKGSGASFFVDFPVSATKPVPPSRRMVAAPPLPSGSAVAGALPPGRDVFKGARVLVVEDEPALASAVKEAFVDAGFVVDRAGDGEEGLARVADHHYDLIVCDLKMPRVDGIRFYRAMTAATPALARRVIFVTGDVAGTDAERFLEDSGCRWLSKPFRLGDLLRAAREALA